MNMLMSAYHQTKDGSIALENQAKIRDQAQIILAKAQSEQPPRRASRTIQSPQPNETVEQLFH